jgi:hypothetical protein
VKDMMWHIACWSPLRPAFEQMRHGTFTGATIQEDTDVVNARWFEQSKRLDLETVKAEWYASRTLMVERFGEIAPLTPDADEWFEETGLLHYESIGTCGPGSRSLRPVPGDRSRKSPPSRLPAVG